MAEAIYTTSQQLTACLNEFVFFVWKILSYFFMYVSESNFHFPQMKLASEKPPEAVFEDEMFTLSIITRNYCPINSASYKVGHFTGVDVDLHQTVMHEVTLSCCLTYLSSFPHLLCGELVHSLLPRT